MQFLGSISFPFYLLHSVVINATNVIPSYSSIVSSHLYINAIIILVFTLVLSYFTHELIDLKLIKYIQTKLWKN